VSTPEEDRDALVDLLLSLSPDDLTAVSAALTPASQATPPSAGPTVPAEVQGAKVELRGVYLTAAALIVVAIITAFSTKETPVACGDERAQAIELVRAYPDAWVDLDDDSPVQDQCDVNELVDKVLNPGSSDAGDAK